MKRISSKKARAKRAKTGARALRHPGWQATLVGAAALTGFGPAQAQTVWTPQNGSTDSHDSSNWSNGAPNWNATVVDGGMTPAIVSANQYVAGLTIGEAVDGARVEIAGGGTLWLDNFIGPGGPINIGNNATGYMLVTGAGSSLYAYAYYDTNIGVNADGHLRIANDALAWFRFLYIGSGNAKGVPTIGAEDGSDPEAPGSVTSYYEATYHHQQNGSIVFNHTGDDYVFNSDLNGGGFVYHRAGTTTLSSSLNSFSPSAHFDGAIEITGGTLLLDQRSVGPTSVSGGGALGGIGTVASLEAGDGGTVSIGAEVASASFRSRGTRRSAPVRPMPSKSATRTSRALHMAMTG